VKGQKYILKSKQAAAAAIILILSAHPIDYSAGYSTGYWSIARLRLWKACFTIVLIRLILPN
jgi:hypothetical protein